MTFTPINPFLHTLLQVGMLCCAAATSFGQEVSGDQRSIESTQPAIHWYKPLAGGPLNLLVILPEDSANEVDELAKRLDMVARVIQTGGRHAWNNPPSVSNQVGPPTNKHLALMNKYDCILIGKIAWDVIPKTQRELILAHVEQGAGLVYVSPYMHDTTIPKTDTTTTKFYDLFRGPDKLGLYRTVYSRTAYAFSQLVYYRDRLVTSDLPALPRNLYRQSPFYLSSQTLGKGRVVALDYDDTTIISPNIPALVPFVDTEHLNALTKQIVPARRDLWLFGLTMAILHSSNRYPDSQVSFLIKSVVPTPRVDRNLVTPRHLREMSPRQFYRYRLSEAEYYVVPPRADESLKTFRYRIRSSFNQTMVTEEIEIAEQDKITFKLPMLEQGHYLLDGFYLDKQGKVINSGNTSIQVVSISKIRECTIPLGDLRNIGTAECELILSQRLTNTQHVKITLTDITGKELQTIPFSADAFSRRFGFSLISQDLPSQPFVLQCTIVDGDGVVVRQRQLIDTPALK
jgi:hypothetical protein